MNKPKLYLSRILVSALLFSILAAPVWAFTLGTSSRSSYILSSTESQKNNHFTFPTIHPLNQLNQSISDFPIATYSEMIPPSFSSGNSQLKSLSFSQQSILYHVSTDQKYTITNTSSADLTLSLVTVQLKPASEIRRAYSNYISSMEDFPKDDTQIYFAVRTVKNSYFLTDEDIFENGFSSEQDSRIRRIHSGETVTFTLPEAEEGQHYRLFMTPEKIPFIMSFDLLISNAPGASVAPPFSDVPQNSYFAVPVAWAVEKKITTGTSDTTFSPDTICTRAQIVTLLYRALAE